MNEAEHVVDWLQRWYSAQCDEHWEHEWGVKIDTLDNPGWSVRIDLEETDLEGHDFPRHDLARSDDDWIMAWTLRHGLPCRMRTSRPHRGTRPLPGVGGGERPDVEVGRPCLDAPGPLCRPPWRHMRSAALDAPGHPAHDPGEDPQSGCPSAQRLAAEGHRDSTKSGTTSATPPNGAINKLTHARALATRHDKRGYVYRGTATAAALTIWLRT
ncbi:immunity 53 family protein [Streptomyces sp. NPDC000983]|uniref:immunity 53 family protein n=1 Tax=Streptomyces sp. NPDC000983 TaxID=3154373 RepID=UPI00331EB0F2